jgi:hypothetical protein
MAQTIFTDADEFVTFLDRQGIETVIETPYRRSGNVAGTVKGYFDMAAMATRGTYTTAKVDIDLAAETSKDNARILAAIRKAAETRRFR